MNTKMTPRASSLAAAVAKSVPGSEVHTLLGELLVIEVNRSNYQPPDRIEAGAPMLTPEEQFDLIRRENEREARFRKQLTIELVKLPGGIPAEIMSALVKS